MATNDEVQKALKDAQFAILVEIKESVGNRLDEGIKQLAHAYALLTGKASG